MSPAPLDLAAGPVLAATSGLLLLTSVIAFGLFAHDKARARSGGRRVRERTLLLAALFGGIGAWLGQQMLRHKTRKEPFRTWLGLAVGVHLLAVGVGVWRVLG